MHAFASPLLKSFLLQPLAACLNAAGPPPSAAGATATVPPLMAAPAAAPAAAFPLAAAGAAPGGPTAVLPAFGGLPTLTAPSAAVTTGWQGPGAVGAQQPNAAQQALNAHLGLGAELPGLGGAGGLGPSGLLGGLGAAQVRKGLGGWLAWLRCAVRGTLSMCPGRSVSLHALRGLVACSCSSVQFGSLGAWG